ncbi:MAG: hypothetical protein JXB85_05055 [Anaerolineales bacterium]|nr:hypothetical protein [Anaerolineales bacterium]
MKQDKFLLAILAFIGIMVVAAVVLFLLRGQKQVEIPDDTPEGVVYNYVLALQQENYAGAYAYLANGNRKPSQAAFERYFLNLYPDVTTLVIDLGEARISGDRARVEIILTHVASDPFSRGWSETGTARLVLQDGQWKIRDMPYQFWGWNWYQP